MHRAQAHALAIRARAEMRLAEEYDAAQDRGEVRAANTGRSASALEAPSASDIGISHKDIHEFRAIRDAERAEPGVVQKTIDRIAERDGTKRISVIAQEVMGRAQPLATRAEAGAKGGRGNKAGDNVTSFERGNSADYLAARIKRDRPDIAEAVERAEQIDEWRRLTLEKVPTGVAPHGGQQRNERGHNKTAEALGVSHETVRRAEAIAALPQEVRDAARPVRPLSPRRGGAPLGLGRPPGGAGRRPRRCGALFESARSWGR